MAPSFDQVPARLRPEWVKLWLLRPQNWLPYTKMTAFWATVDRDKKLAEFPGESDPFLSPAPGWKLVEGFPAVTGEEQVEIVRDFLYGMPAGVPFPAVGEDPMVFTLPAPTAITGVPIATP